MFQNEIFRPPPNVRVAARNVPLRRIVLAGGAKSYGFSLGAFNAPAKETELRLIAPIHYHQQEDIVADSSSKHGASWTVLRPHLVMEPSLNSPMNLVTSLAAYAAMSRELGLPLRSPGCREAGTHFMKPPTQSCLGVPPCGHSARIAEGLSSLR